LLSGNYFGLCRAASSALGWSAKNSSGRRIEFFGFSLVKRVSPSEVYQKSRGPGPVPGALKNCCHRRTVNPRGRTIHQKRAVKFLQGFVSLLPRSDGGGLGLGFSMISDMAERRMLASASLPKSA